jgi:hypothetical protein
MKNLLFLFLSTLLFILPSCNRGDDLGNETSYPSTFIYSSYEASSTHLYVIIDTLGNYKEIDLPSEFEKAMKRWEADVKSNHEFWLDIKSIELLDKENLELKTYNGEMTSATYVNKNNILSLKESGVYAYLESDVINKKINWLINNYFYYVIKTKKESPIIQNPTFTTDLPSALKIVIKEHRLSTNDTICFNLAKAIYSKN